MNKLDFVKKGMLGSKYLAEGCEFKKNNDNFKLVATSNKKYEPFLGQLHSESVWNLISESSVTAGVKHNETYGLLLDHFKSGQTIFNKDTNILLKKGEYVIFQSPNSIYLKEPKSIRVTNSVRTGSSRRHGKSSFGYGTSKSVGETKEVIKNIDIGQIIITNKRFIYSGQKRNIDVNISQITGISPHPGGFKLQRKSKQKPEYFTNVNSFVFNYTFNGDTYFYIMDGQIIKAMIEGGLNKTPQTSKLQKLASQKQIESKNEMTSYSLDDFVFKASDNWKVIKNEETSDGFALERIDGKYRAEINISKSYITLNGDEYGKKVKELFDKEGFSLLGSEEIISNGIKLVNISFVNDIGGKSVEFDVAYFFSDEYHYSLYFKNDQSNAAAKDDYEKILRSLKLKDDVKGSDVKPKANFCPNCGIHIEHDGNFCQNCGFKLV